jgi:hypothetical protein
MVTTKKWWISCPEVNIHLTELYDPVIITDIDEIIWNSDWVIIHKGNQVFLYPKVNITEMRIVLNAPK